MNIAVVILLGLLSAFVLAAFILCLSLPAARALVRRPRLSKRSVVLRTLFAVALISIHYYQEPQSLWGYYALVVGTLGLATMYWPQTFRTTDSPR